MYNKYRVPFYYCKLHRNIESVYLETIEHHCKFSGPELHKSEVLKSLKKFYYSYCKETTTRKRKSWRFKLIIESYNFFDIAVLMLINYFLYCTSVSKLGHQQHAQSYQPALNWAGFVLVIHILCVS